MLDDARWIFVNYVPGAFGSFITKVIESSPDVYNTDGESFDAYGASHENVTEWLRKFHHGNDLDYWSTLSASDRSSYINFTDLCYKTDLHRVHRLTLPKHHDLFLETFSQAKFIKVVFDQEYFDLIVDMMCSKTYEDTLENVIKHTDSQLYKVLTNTTPEQQQKWYRKQCIKRIEDINDQQPAERTFLFNIKTLFDQTSDSFSALFDFLEIAPGNYTKLHTDFLKIHQNLG